MKSLIALSLALAVSAPVPSVSMPSSQDETPEDVARSFYESYGRQDLNALRSLFASEAQVIRFRIERDGHTKIDKDDALKWVSNEERSFQRVTEITVELGEASTLIVDIGASVSLAVETQRIERGERIRTAGIATFSLAQLGGRWRIMQLSSFERER